jgi:hypothetical protein
MLVVPSPLGERKGEEEKQFGSGEKRRKTYQ